MIRAGSLIEQMMDARDNLFRGQIRRSREGRTYFECMTPGCKGQAVAHHVQCERHLSATQQEQQRELERERNETPQARQWRLAIEGKAKQLANQDGRGADWRDRRYMLRAQRIVEAKGVDGGDIV